MKTKANGSPRQTKRGAQSESPVRSTKRHGSVASLPRVNGAKLNFENRAYQHPLFGLGNDRYMLMEGWRLVGWASAQYRGAGQHAIVYERLTLSEDDVFEVGKLYWCHGDATKMQIYSNLPADLEDELGPWVGR